MLPWLWMIYYGTRTKRINGYENGEQLNYFQFIEIEDVNAQTKRKGHACICSFIPFIGCSTFLRSLPYRFWYLLFSFCVLTVSLSIFFCSCERSFLISPWILVCWFWWTFSKSARLLLYWSCNCLMALIRCVCTTRCCCIDLCCCRRRF